MEDKKLDNKNKKEEKKKLKKKKRDKEDKKDEEGKKEIKLDETPKLQCLKIQVNSHITEFLYYQRYPKKNNEKYDPKLCALVYYFNENLDDKFFYLYFSLMGQIDEIFFGYSYWKIDFCLGSFLLHEFVLGLPLNLLYLPT